MKSIFSLFTLLLIAGSSFCQTNNPNYNTELAEKLGGDDYGMKQYVFVILKSGANTSDDKEAMNTAFAGHMKNIGRLAEEGKLVVAGPMEKNDKSYRGIFILNVTTLEEAEALLASDPAIAENYLAAETYLWYGSAALPEYLEAHDKIWSKGIWIETSFNL